MSFNTLLKKYASLIVKSGLNVQENQIVVIEGSIESYPLIREVAKQAYQLNCKEVVVRYHDEYLTRLRYENVALEEFSNIPTWLSTFKNDYATQNACFLYIEDEDPESLMGIDPRKVANYGKAFHKACKTYYDLSNNMTNAWCIVGASSTKWANKVFPDMSDEEAKLALWQAIFKTAKIDEDNDPNDIWLQHKQSFEKRVAYLNSLNLKELVYKNSLGTDITVGLTDNYLFAGGGSYLNNGLYNFPNIPTEEIFTSPHRDKANGKVYSSLPLNYNGNIIDEFYLEFKDGKIIDFKAKKGQDVLKEIIETDEGSHHLGEVALIPYDSPISNMNTLFYSTLYDENAACHMAIGIGFGECIKDGVGKDAKELLKEGVNDSYTHVDFMIGTKDLSIIGIDKDNKEIEIFKNGNFCF